MIELYIDNASFAHEIFELLKAFMPDKQVIVVEDKNDVKYSSLTITVDCKDSHIDAKLWDKRNIIDTNIELLEDILAQTDRLLRTRYEKNAAKRCVYGLISRLLEKDLDWGILTGIRPTKIVNELLDERRYTNEDIIKILDREYKLSESKSNLLIDTVSQQRDILAGNSDDMISLYIHIPFCTTRCLYCSFPSDTIARCEDVLDAYIAALLYEWDSVLPKLLNKGFSVQTLYIGGGTPTALPIHNLRQLLKGIDTIAKPNLEEYTVEAGRPDSLTVEKLKLLKEYGVGRISINPQTMNEGTLKTIGRAHTPKDIKLCFEAARRIGFDSINMDVIVGLPGEGLREIENTMRQIFNLSPDNLTVHTLAIKRGSPLRDRLSDFEFAKETLAEEMLNECDKWAQKMGMRPYYLYRQKYILGNLENIGYAKPHKRCLYNIQMMEEKQTIFGFGAGGMSKIFFSSNNRIERVANVKDYRQYIYRVDEMIQRKLNMIDQMVI
ncbi:MAG: coproporphyrinogen dehydrogenase HemZ [Clostridiales bacterium]|nr:coproporphyrinogen dehydrogenase HemZ [Clostridiales bacterium]